MASAGNVVIDFSAETAKFTSELKKVRGELKTLQGQVGGISTQLGKAGNAIKGFVGGFALIATARAAIGAVAAATAESEAAVSQLESALKSAGRSVATESPKFQEFASRLQGVSTFTDEAVIGVESLLLSFKGLSGDTVLRASAAVLDVSTRLGTDLRGAAFAVGKSLQDPIQGLSALSRMGVVFSDSQKSVIKAMIDSGDRAGAQAKILEELEKRFGGAAEAARNNFSGALAGLKNSLGDLLEAKGGLPETTANLNELSRVLQDPGVKAGADAIFGSLIRGASAAAEFIGKTAAGLAILAGAGGNAIVDIDRQLGQLEERRNRILSSVGGDQSLLGPGFRKELDEANLKIDDLLRKQRQLLEVGEFSGNASLRPQAVTATRLEEREPVDPAAEIARQQQLADLRLKLIENQFNSASAILDELAAKQKILDDQRSESLTIYTQRELDILVESFDRKFAIEQEYTDEVLRQQKIRSENEVIAQSIIRDQQFETLNVASGFLQTLAQRSKAAAIAAIVLNRGLSIAQAIQNTAVAATAALKLPYPANLAAYAQVKALGALQVGIIAATGGLEIAGAASSGGSSGGAYASDSKSASVAPEQSITPSTQAATNVYINGYISNDVVDDLVDQLDDRFRNGTIVIRGGTNQADEIRRGG